MKLLICSPDFAFNVTANCFQMALFGVSYSHRPENLAEPFLGDNCLPVTLARRLAVHVELLHILCEKFLIL